MRDLLESRTRLATSMRELVDNPADSGDLSPEQETRFDTLKGELGAVEKRIEKQALLDEVDRRMSGVQISGAADDKFEQLTRGFSIQRAIASMLDGRSVDAGRELEVSQELCRRAGKSSEGVRVPLEALIEKRVALSTGDAGQLISTDYLASEMVDVLRPASVVMASGARVLTGLTGNIAVPVMDAYTPTAAWVAENASLTAGDLSFAQLTASPKTCGLLAEWSRRVLLQSNPAIEGLIRSDFTAKLAAAIDVAALKGTGTNQPVGIKTTAGVQTYTSGLATNAAVITVMTKVEAVDAPQTSLGWVGNAWVKAKLKNTLRTSADTASNTIMGDTNTLGGQPYRTTSQLAGQLVGTSPAVAGEAIYGSWDQLILCWWSQGAEILVNPYESVAYTKGNILLRAFIDANILVRNPQAFVYVSGITV